MRIEVFDGPDELAAGAANRIAELLAGPGPHSLGLAGGSTPEATYGELAKKPLDWTEVQFWLGDERWVPNDSSESNGAMAGRHLTDKVGGHLHQISYSSEQAPEAAARQYENGLREIFGQSDDEPDVVLLGLGDDGHTASLFPGTAALLEIERDYVANYVPKLDTWRLTATIPLLQRSRQIVFLISGEAKAEATRLLVQPDESDVIVPARMVADASQDPLLLLDEGAASRI